MLLVSVGSFVLLLVVLYLIAAPATRPDPAEEPGEASALLARKERLLTDIRELDMDLITGKLDEEDHRHLRTATMANAVDTLRALEELGAADGIRDASGVTAATDDVDRLEALIAARKQELEVRTHAEPSATRAMPSPDGEGSGARPDGERKA